MRSASKILVIAVLAGALAACGGASDSPPGPLAKHFDDMYIAAIPLDQKQAMVKAQNDWSMAKMENAKAEADYNESTTQLEIVRNEHKAAQLSVESAVASKKAAEASADTNRVNDATANMHHAETALKAANERIKYFEVYREYLKFALRFAQETMYWREAQYESSKAQLGQRNSIAPKGVTYDSFPKQEEERQKRSSSAKDRLESQRGRALSARDNWLKAQEASDRESGRAGNLSDPMATRTR